jgi:hypothetical protein
VAPRRVVPILVLCAAAFAAAIPIMGLSAPSSGYPDLRSDPVERPALEASGGRLLLRFDGFVTNVGSGPLDVTGDPSVAGGMKQRVQQAGSWTTVGSPTVLYETADGHSHFHLMNAMRYSLWTSDRRAEMAPAQKVGFCLYDLQQADGAPVTDPDVYAPVNFCNRNQPDATSLSMGVSAGWRDVYDRNLALQWVDVSSTAPGNYLIAAESDPLGRIVESNESNNGRAYRAFTLPGHLASAVGPIEVRDGRPTTVTLAATTIGAAGTRRFRVESAPAHGSLDVAAGGSPSGAQVLYTPDPGYSGPDSFGVSAYASSGVTAGFPRNPARATVTLQVGARVVPTVQISGAPSRLVAGTSARLAAAVSNGAPGVVWSADAGTVSADGLYVAPAQVPPGGAARVRAAGAADPSAFAEVRIAIDPVPPVVPARGGLGGTPGAGAAGGRALLGAPSTRRRGRIIVVRTLALASGRLSVVAIRHGRGRAKCRVTTVAGRRAACRLKLPRGFARTPVRLVLRMTAAGGARVVVDRLSR